MNSVQLVGRLATEIDLKEVTGGSKVSSFILAVDRNAEEADLRILPTVRRSSWVRAGGKSAP
jgi:single-stranded DNA-binding protein